MMYNIPDPGRAIKSWETEFMNVVNVAGALVILQYDSTLVGIHCGEEGVLGTSPRSLGSNFRPIEDQEM